MVVSSIFQTPKENSLLSSSILNQWHVFHTLVPQMVVLNGALLLFQLLLSLMPNLHLPISVSMPLLLTRTDSSSAAHSTSPSIYLKELPFVTPPMVAHLHLILEKLQKQDFSAFPKPPSSVSVSSKKVNSQALSSHAPIYIKTKITNFLSFPLLPTFMAFMAMNTASSYRELAMDASAMDNQPSAIGTQIGSAL